jgi:tetratricopeptide (TPR) repeat protein
LGNQKRYDEAVIHYREAIKLNPDHSQARKNLEVVLEIMKKKN